MSTNPKDDLTAFYLKKFKAGLTAAVSDPSAFQEILKGYDCLAKENPNDYAKLLKPFAATKARLPQQENHIRRVLQPRPQRHGPVRHIPR